LKILNKCSLFTRRSPRRASIRAYKRAARFSLTKISHRSHRGARAHLVVRNQCPFIETRSISRADENYFRSLCESLSARASKRKNLGSLILKKELLEKYSRTDFLQKDNNLHSREQPIESKREESLIFRYFRYFIYTV